jgi:hypothetical protein
VQQVCACTSCRGGGKGRDADRIGVRLPLVVEEGDPVPDDPDAQVRLHAAQIPETPVHHARLASPNTSTKHVAAAIPNEVVAEAKSLPALAELGPVGARVVRMHPPLVMHGVPEDARRGRVRIVWPMGIHSEGRAVIIRHAAGARAGRRRARTRRGSWWPATASITAAVGPTAAPGAIPFAATRAMERAPPAQIVARLVPPPC